MRERAPYIKSEKDLLDKIEMQERAIKVLNNKIKEQKGQIKDLKYKLKNTREILRHYNSLMMNKE